MLSKHSRLKLKPGSETEEQINLDCSTITMKRHTCKCPAGWPGRGNADGEGRVLIQKFNVSHMKKNHRYAFWLELKFYQGGNKSVL